MFVQVVSWIWRHHKDNKVKKKKNKSEMEEPTFYLAQ